MSRPTRLTIPTHGHRSSAPLISDFAAPGTLPLKRPPGLPVQSPLWPGITAGRNLFPIRLFNAYKSLFAYDKTPLHAVIESVEQSENWKREKITFDAAYGKERMIAYLFLPRKATPPFQTIVYFPGADAMYTRSSKICTVDSYDFIIKSGRAVIFPRIQRNLRAR